MRKPKRKKKVSREMASPKMDAIFYCVYALLNLSGGKNSNHLAVPPIPFSRLYSAFMPFDFSIWLLFSQQSVSVACEQVPSRLEFVCPSRAKHSLTLFLLWGAGALRMHFHEQTPHLEMCSCKDVNGVTTGTESKQHRKHIQTQWIMVINLIVIWE